MGAEADRLREEQEALQRELEAMEAEKQKGEAEAEAHAHELEAAKERLESAKATARPAIDYETIKEEIRRGIQGRHGEVCREIDDGWEAHMRYLDGTRQDLEKEMREAAAERKKLQEIKVKLRDNGVAEFQTYTPSSVGGTPHLPPSQISPISYSGERQQSQAMVAVGEPQTIPPTPEAS
eukprot:Gregarina_sp_Pseudo_9__877@NODE_155_length_3943_cov_41_170850_g142_i0_p3_GENE_NODE_155_length_3943_cov_41_170850_g142_i0NODE_155_length_3943_cov_41_170850_g142_i0_p3_ORF_typecomplete_len180_score47_01CENPF_N/PF10481_9/0_0018THOC7/PF05615_13/0_0016THOC7/PF05615_13/3_2e02CENPF_leu_zip/PF10473_9/0_55MIS13/PF08202_11/0_023MAD/PF05557_13/0_028APG6_N/PF17675_1/0_22APG6_N/PF17675_1/12TMF_TATA_bd/PF12325_8/5_6TMF_TATA_bd/PF12325_8/1_1TPR_MLP1_2/PF07926_12/2_7TPR_MLP1_2/PF07926_12/5_3Phage_HK97_TLTM/PF06